MAPDVLAARRRKLQAQVRPGQYRQAWRRVLRRAGGKGGRA